MQTTSDMSEGDREEGGFALSLMPKRPMLVNLPPQAHVKVGSAPWRPLNAQAREHEDPRWQIDAGWLAAVCPIEPNKSAAKFIENGGVFKMDMYALAGTIAEQCFPEPLSEMAGKLVRCMRDADQWWVLLADLWQHTNKIKQACDAARDVKQALNFMNITTHARVHALGRWLQQLDTGEAKSAPTVHLANETVKFACSLGSIFVPSVLICTSKPGGFVIQICHFCTNQY